MWHEWDRRKIKKRKEIMGYWWHTGILFSTHLVTLERFRRDDFKNTLKNHQIRS
jgi:hypothetical protein